MAIIASQKRSSSLRFALGGLDHERAGDREGHGRRVVAIVHEALRGVFDLEAVFLPRAEIDDALVGDEAALPLVEHGEERLEALGDVVGVEDGELRRAVRPSGPIMRIYIHEMTRMLALPQGRRRRRRCAES
jgi:hypothetical protein